MLDWVRHMLYLPRQAA